MKIKHIFLCLLIGPSWASEDHQEHDAHVHGHAEMSMALSGTELELELESPAMNLVGFEYHPKSSRDKEKVNAADAFLSRPGNWILLDKEAGCTLEKVDVESALLEKESREHDDHDDHGKHDEHDEHGKHDDHDEHEQHADFEVTVKYRCLNADNLATVNLKGLFQQFPALEEIDVQWLTDQRQSASELDAKNSMIRLK